MAESIKIRLDESRYIPPTQDDIREAKQYVLRREDNARQLRDSVDEVLSNLAEDIVTCCYKYNVDPYTFTISSSYNEDMMAEISDFMDDAELEILDLIYDYSTKATKDNDHIAALIAWLATLGRGNRNLQDTLDGYLYKTMKDFEAAIAAMRFMGVKLSDAVTKLKTYMHSVYTMPEVLTAFRRRQNFNAAYIRLGGVQPGAVGLSNNGSTNVTNMATITSQMAWMREQGIQMRESGASGYYQLRGSTFNCDLCDDEVGFHPNLDEIETAPYPHPHCKCYRVPIYPVEDSSISENTARKNRREEYERLLQDPNYKDVEYNPENGGLKATHIYHNFDKIGGKYEKHVQNAGFKAGHSVIFGAEVGDVIGQRFTEGTWDGMRFEVAGRETATSINILRGLKHCASKRNTEIAILDFPKGGFNLSTLENGISRYRGLAPLNDGQYLKFRKIICVQDEVVVYEQDF